MLYRFICFCDRPNVRGTAFLLLIIAWIVVYKDWTLNNPYGWNWPDGFMPYKWLYIEIPLALPGFLVFGVRYCFKREGFEA